MSTRCRDTWSLTPKDLPPDWMIAREPLLAGAEENAIFRFIHHRRRLGRPSGDGEIGTVGAFVLSLMFCHIGVAIFVVWLLIKLIRVSVKTKTSREDTVFHYLPRATLDDLLSAPIRKGEYARALWAGAVSARYCWWQKFKAWTLGALGGGLFLFCRLMHYLIARHDIYTDIYAGQKLAFAVIGEVIAGLMLCIAAETIVSFRHLPYSCVRGQLTKLRRRRAEIIAKINVAEAFWRVIGQFFIVFCVAVMMAGVIAVAGSVITILPAGAYDTIAALLSEPVFDLFSVLAIVVAVSEVRARHALSHHREWLGEIERHAEWFGEYIRLVEHEPSDKAALKKHAMRPPGRFEFNRL